MRHRNNGAQLPDKTVVEPIDPPQTFGWISWWV
jgi:hypothetical protein